MYMYDVYMYPSDNRRGGGGLHINKEVGSDYISVYPLSDLLHDRVWIVSY